MKISRRQLLVSAAAAPLVPALDSLAFAAAPPPRRLLLLFSSGGMVPDLYWPTPKNPEADAKDTVKADFTFTPGSSLEPLEPFRGDLVILNGLARKMMPLGGAHERAMGA
ncbi:MAG TPA: DUF1552 domain-containing protein, partial [Polyangia bacterium]|nr:DUF1552 domain-containing protein [Polyangia bacterium]